MHKVCHFYIKHIKHLCLLGDKCKFTANVKDKDLKITKMHHFECYIQHLNVATFGDSFECRTFVYALQYTIQ